MPLTNAERQRRYRQRRHARQPLVRYRRPQDRRARPQRWAEAVATLRELQQEYADWLDALPENLQEGTLADKLQAIVDLDLSELEEVDLPRGFGRD